MTPEVRLERAEREYPVEESYAFTRETGQDRMAEVFGEQDLHARSVFGAASVRGNLPVIIDSIFEVD